MSYDDPTTEQPVHPVYAGEGQATAPVSFPMAGEGGYLASDEDDEWVSEAPKGLRVPAITGALLLLLFAASGFWGGAILQKHHDRSTAATSVATLGAAARRAAAAGGLGGGAGGFGGGAGTGTGTRAGTGTGTVGSGPAADGTTGIVTDVQGTTLYLTDTAGNLVKVTLTPSSKITRSAAGTAADLQQGQTVTITGSRAADGSTTASAITITPATSAATTPAGG